MKCGPVMLFCLSAVLAGTVEAASLAERLAAVHGRFLDERRQALAGLSDPFDVPEAAKVVVEQPREPFRAKEAWKRNVVGTVFWVGEPAGAHNPVPNTMSAWDRNWLENFGGHDHPQERSGYLPAGFLPKLNSFYVALPYNDLGKDGSHRPEARRVIPWFWEKYRGEGVSVCKGRWLAIHYRGRVCFAQWENVGPFEVDHWEYVFGKEAPRANRNGGAGIDLSPAVRDFLKFHSGDRVEWRFVEDHEVPEGPWLRESMEFPLPRH